MVYPRVVQEVAGSGHLLPGLEAQAESDRLAKETAAKISGELAVEHTVEFAEAA
jgi:hypothetical protein